MVLKLGFLMNYKKNEISVRKMVYLSVPFCDFGHKEVVKRVR